MEKILLLSAPLKERIWGGDYFKNVLKVTDSSSNIGEMWSCSGHKEGESIILNGEFKNKTLSEVYKKHKELFNDSIKSEDFPILIKLIDTKDLLSIQVHPNDEYAKKYENQLGKTEGRLILDSKEDSNIVIGHKAKDKNELVKAINEDKIENYLNYYKVKKGEFYPIPSGTLHAIGKNILLLEVQQSSDVTYRFYDYHRKDKDGKERELHVNKALDVVSFDIYKEEVKNHFGLDSSILWQNKYFLVTYYDLTNIHECSFETLNNYLIVSVIEGEVMVDDKYKINKGFSFIILKSKEKTKLSGKNLKIVVTEYLDY